jgi:molybdate transport system regulatory protein
MSTSRIQVDGQLWFNGDSKGYLGGKRIDLLEQIDRTGSITKAARAAGLSYKAAWDALDAVNNLSEKPLVVRAVGGQGGGGTLLTPFGRQIVHTWRRMQTEYERFLAHLAEGIDASYDFDDVNNLLRAIAMKTSARNQLRGTVSRVEKGAVNADVILDLGNGQEIFANITNDAVDELALAPGSRAIAIIKASFVILSPDADVRISARNRLRGTIVKLVPGAVNAELKLELPGGKILTAVVTRESVDEFGFAVGQPCTALVKASHVIIAVE